MTQYSANPIDPKKKAAPPKKGTLITFKENQSPFLFFKIAGGGTIPDSLKGGWISQKDADVAQARYEASRRPSKAGVAKQESETIRPVSELMPAASA